MAMTPEQLAEARKKIDDAVVETLQEAGSEGAAESTIWMSLGSPSNMTWALFISRLQTEGRIRVKGHRMYAVTPKK